MRDALLLAVGTLTRLPVAPPRRVDPRSARGAMLLAPLIGAVLGLLVGGIAQMAMHLPSGSAAPLLLSVLAIGAVAWLTRGIHLDGIADTADALGSGRPADEALAIARRSDIGPFGVMALLIVMLVQVAAYAPLIADGRAAVALAIALGSGRAGLLVACARGIPAARADGLGAAVAGSVPVPAGAGALVVWAGLCAAGAAWAGLSPAGALAAALGSILASAVLVRTCRRRLGGITGDVLGAVVESATATALVILVLVPS